MSIALVCTLLFVSLIVVTIPILSWAFCSFIRGSKGVNIDRLWMGYNVVQSGYMTSVDSVVQGAKTVALTHAFKHRRALGLQLKISRVEF